MKVYFIIILFTALTTQEIYTEYLIIDLDTIDTFSYQIPSDYDNNMSHPLLLTFHQWM